MSKTEARRSGPDLSVGVSSCVAGDGDSLSALLERARRFGLAAVEIGYEHSGPALEDGESRRRLVEEAVEHAGLIRSLHAPYRPGRDLSLLDEGSRRGAVARAVSAFELASDLGVGIVNLHVSEEPIVATERAARVRAAHRSLLALTPRAHALGVRVAVETMPPEWIPALPDEIDELLEGQDPDTVGLCLDTNHSNLNADLGDYVSRFCNRIIGLHVSDNDGVKQRHWMPGEGLIDWGALVGALRAAEVGAPLLYEVETPGRDLEDSLRRVIENFERRLSTAGNGAAGGVS